MNTHSEHILGSVKIQMLAGFSEKDRKDFLTAGSIREYYKNDRIIVEHQKDLHVYLVMDGWASVWRKEIRLSELRAGDMFNETKIFLPKTNTATVIAEEPTSVLKFSRSGGNPQGIRRAGSRVHSR